MLIVSKSEKEKQEFFDQFEQSMNNVYMSVDLTITTAANKPVYAQKLDTMTHEQHYIYKKVAKYNKTNTAQINESEFNHPLVKEWHTTYQMIQQQNCKKIENYKKLL